MPPCSTLKTGVNLVFFIPGTDCQGAREGAGVEHYILVSEYGKSLTREEYKVELRKYFPTLKRWR